MITFQQVRNSMGVSLERVSNELRELLNNPDALVSGCEALSRWERGVEPCPNWSLVIKALYNAHNRLLEENSRLSVLELAKRKTERL